MLLASLLFVNCDRAGLSVHGDGGVPAGAAGSGQGGFRGFGAMAGSGGASGTGSGGTQIVSTQAIGADGLLYDTGATLSLVAVSQDERHVAFMRDFLPLPDRGPGEPDYSGCAMQVGTLLVAAIADDGTVAVREVGQGVNFDSIGFSADSRSMAYVDGRDPCSIGGVLKVAAADGSNPRTIGSVPISLEDRIMGNTLQFLMPPVADANTQSTIGEPGYVLRLPDGAPLSVPGPYGELDGWISQDGRRAGYVDAAGNLIVVDVTSGASHQVDLGLGTSALDYTVFLHWSPNGGFFTAEVTPNPSGQVGLAVAAAGDTKAHFLAQDSLSPNEVFSPDSSRLAYQTMDSAGAPDLVVRSLAAGTNVHVQGLPDPAGSVNTFSFSPDGAMLLVTATDSVSYVMSLYTGSADGSGSLQLVTSGTTGFFAMPPGDGNVAVELNSGYTQVFSFNGADSNVLPGNHPVYEPNSAQPRLLLYPLLPLSQAPASNPAPAFVLTSTDGTNMQTVVLPTGASLWSRWDASPQWMGHTVMYGFSPALTGAFPAIYAWTGDSSSPTLLAADPDAFAWAPIPVPTRLFYVRAAASSAGPAGLWMVSLP